IRIGTLEIADLPSQSQGSLKIEAKVDRRDYILQELLTAAGQYRKRGDFIYLLLRRWKDRTRDVSNRWGYNDTGRNEPCIEVQGRRCISRRQAGIVDVSLKRLLRGRIDANPFIKRTCF